MLKQVFKYLLTFIKTYIYPIFLFMGILYGIKLFLIYLMTSGYATQILLFQSIWALFYRLLGASAFGFVVGLMLCKLWHLVRILFMTIRGFKK